VGKKIHSSAPAIIMDFAKPLITIPNVVSKANIRYISLPEEEHASVLKAEASLSLKTDCQEEADKISCEADASIGVTTKSDETIDRMVIEASNRAASELMLSNTSSFQSVKKLKLSSTESTAHHQQHQALVDTSLYPTHLREQDTIKPNSLVVIYESFESITFAYATPDATYTNRNGTFRHNDFLFQNYGCKIQSTNNKGCIYILKPTPELWMKTLNHRTQIIHESDAAFMIYQLDLRPNQIVCESGTGSGAFSHCILRSIAPYGTLHTYEFNQARVLAARDEFKKNGVDHMVQVYWRDVCGDIQEEKKKQSLPIKEEEVMGQGGFNLGPRVAHAISLDLPEPWKAIPHAAYTLVPNGRLCSYSPCIEQVQKTIQAMKKHGYHSIQTFEIRLREYYLDKVVMRPVPTKKLPRMQPRTPWIPSDAPSETAPINNTLEEDDDDDGVLGMKKMNPGEEEEEQQEMATVEQVDKSDHHPKTDKVSNIPPVLCARPFPMIKGHSAFLTFATASINPK
jgi:tRNA (adenine57-N1/adenine58-N1)-methyltransferase